MSDFYPYKWTRDYLPPKRKDQSCYLIERRAGNTALVEFEDGAQFVVVEAGLEKLNKRKTRPGRRARRRMREEVRDGTSTTPGEST